MMTYEEHVCLPRRSIYPICFKSRGLPASLMIQKLTQRDKYFSIKSRSYQFLHIFISFFVNLEEKRSGTASKARTRRLNLLWT